jgi:FAD/FMN-containing dehydrogenase
VIAGAVELSAQAPDRFSAILNLITAPPMPFLPPAVVGSPILMAMLAYAGGPEAADPVVAGFRALATPLADMVAPMPYAGLFPPDDASYHPMGAVRTMFLDRVDRDLAGRLLERMVAHKAATDAMMVVAQLRVLGGAIGRVPADATAYAHRDSAIMVNLAALYTDRADGPAHEAYVNSLVEEIRQTDEGASAYPGGTWDRLLEIKRRYDPTNLFHRNQNIWVG